MRAADFAFDLPERLIAQEPLADRSASRMLVLHRATGQTEHRSFRDIVEYLAPGDLLVTNDTRVTAVRLLGLRETGGKVEALLLNAAGPSRYIALVKPAKKLRPGEVVLFEECVRAKVVEDLGDGRKLLELVGPGVDEALARVGRVPLPPYVKTQIQDAERYQTVYASVGGSAAAPTAGLHFTQETFKKLESKGVQRASVTLDVSLDTFRPISAVNLEDHVMHGERCVMPKSTAEAIESCGGRVLAVGTTSARTIETFAKPDDRVESGEAVSRLYITPGYEFRALDALLTNFHMPGTTMVLLVAALAGREPLLRAYREAVEKEYRFLSFGDAMLVI